MTTRAAALSALLLLLLATAPPAVVRGFAPPSHRRGRIPAFSHVRTSASASASTTRLFSTVERPKEADATSDADASDPEAEASDLLAALEEAGASLEGEEPAAGGSLLGPGIPYGELTVGVLRESFPGENRVSVAPESVKSLVDAGFQVAVESGGEFFGVGRAGRRRDIRFGSSFFAPFGSGEGRRAAARGGGGGRRRARFFFLHRRRRL